jgi:hypothetical protein
VRVREERRRGSWKIRISEREHKEEQGGRKRTLHVRGSGLTYFPTHENLNVT